MAIYRTTQTERLERASREAAEWLQVLRDDASAAEREAFVSWVRASPLHLRELLTASMLERELSRSDLLAGFDVDAIIARTAASKNVVPLHEPAAGSHRDIPVRDRAATRKRRRRRFPGLAWAAAIAAVAMLGVAMLFSTYVASGQGVRYATHIGEHRVFTLSDGSVVTLAPDSSLRVVMAADERDIILGRGEADFQVAHDRTRPFRVHAGASVIQAVGTRFTVNRLPSGTVVEVTEGVVKVMADHMSAFDDGIDAWVKSWLPAPIAPIKRPNTQVTRVGDARNLVAGEAAHIARNGREMAQGALEREPVSSDGQKRLVFHDDPLGDIAAEFNRYRTTPIKVEGEALRLQRYSGVFDANDAQSFLDFLDCCSALRVVKQQDAIVISARRRTAAKRR